MIEESHLTPLLAPLAALQCLLDRYAGRGVIIGGIAASLIGKPRLTADLDALILLPIEELPEFYEAAKAEGLEGRISEPLEFARQNHVLLLRHTESYTNIDISLGLLPFEQEMIKRSNLHHVAGLTLNLPTPEDLIIMKAVAHRPKDLLDIEGIVQSQPTLDKERIGFWVKQFADLLEKPELWDDIVDLLG
jgi:hypothetical protein